MIGTAAVLVIHIAIPRIICIIPSVAKNDGNLSFVTSKPFINPTNIPNNIDAKIASNILFVACRTSAENIALIAAVEPTVKSICPAPKTNTPATAITDTIAVCLNMFNKFPEAMNPLPFKAIEKNINTIPRTMYTVNLLNSNFL